MGAPASLLLRPIARTWHWSVAWALAISVAWFAPLVAAQGVGIAGLSFSGAGIAPSSGVGGTGRFHVSRCKSFGTAAEWIQNAAYHPWKQFSVKRFAKEYELLWRLWDKRFLSTRLRFDRVPGLAQRVPGGLAAATSFDAIAAFKDYLRGLSKRLNGNWRMEGYLSPDAQKKNSVEWSWGHYLRFGADYAKRGNSHFEVSQHMDAKWLNDLIHFQAGFGFNWSYFRDAEILDIGVWTGATSFALAGVFGAKRVVAVEEAQKYALVADFVARAYEMPITVINESLYNLEQPSLAGAFDIVYFPGVLYHLSDPFVALRILYNRLKTGGVMLIDTMRPHTLPKPGHGAANVFFEGVSSLGNNHYSFSSGSLRLLLYEVGFDDVILEDFPFRRLKGIARRTQYRDFKRAGASRQDLC